MFWSKKKRQNKKASQAKCVYAGPEYFARLNRSKDPKDEPAMPECVYAGPEVADPDVPELDFAEPEIPEPEIIEPEIPAPVYAGPEPDDDPNRDSVIEAEPEIVDKPVINNKPVINKIKRPRFGRVYAGPEFFDKRKTLPDKTGDPGSIAQPVYAAPVPRTEQQGKCRRRKKYPDPEKDDQNFEDVYGGPGMMGELM